MTHEHTKEQELHNREAALDNTLAETFPASDALSTLPNPDDERAPAHDQPFARLGRQTGENPLVEPPPCT